MSSKLSSATLCHFKKSKFPFRKQAVGSLLTLSKLIFPQEKQHPRKTIVPQQKNLVRGCCNMLIHLSKSDDTLKHKNVFFFWKLQRNDTSDVDLRICGRFQFFYRKSENVCGKKSVCKYANQNLEYAICGPMCGRVQHCTKATDFC